VVACDGDGDELLDGDGEVVGVAVVVAAVGFGRADRPARTVGTALGNVGARSDPFRARMAARVVGPAAPAASPVASPPAGATAETAELAGAAGPGSGPKIVPPSHTAGPRPTATIPAKNAATCLSTAHLHHHPYPSRSRHKRTGRFPRAARISGDGIGADVRVGGSPVISCSPPARRSRAAGQPLLSSLMSGRLPRELSASGLDNAVVAGPPIHLGWVRGVHPGAAKDQG
jgi:hypothetical protein